MLCLFKRVLIKQGDEKYEKSNVQTGYNFRGACQQLKSRSEHQLALTYWMGFHSGMSAIEIKVRTSTGTHSLDGISQWHVSN